MGLYKFLLISALLVLAYGKNEQYEGHSLYEVQVNDAAQAQIVSEIENIFSIDVWSSPTPNRPGQILVAADVKEYFEKELTAARIEYKVIVENIKEYIDLEDNLLKNKRATKAQPDFSTILEFEEVEDYIHKVAAEYPNLVTLFNAGKTLEGRDMWYLKISSTNFQDKSKPVVFMHSLLHAREWVTLPATLYAINQLVTNPQQDLLQDIDWIIMPVANPDGYVFSHAESRFWRKNRAINNIGSCPGVDLNRNFDFAWSQASSSNPCSDTYHGRTPFSELETSAIRDILLAEEGRIALYTDIHSFGSMILYGFGTGVLPPNGLTINLVAVRMAQAIDAVKASWNPNYIVGNVALVLYRASGSSIDYALDSARVPLAYTFELPGHRLSSNTVLGFLVDPDFIEQAGMETWEAIKVGARYARDNYRSLLKDV